MAPVAWRAQYWPISIRTVKLQTMPSKNPYQETFKSKMVSTYSRQDLKVKISNNPNWQVPKPIANLSLSATATLRTGFPKTKTTLYSHQSFSQRNRLTLEKAREEEQACSKIDWQLLKISLRGLLKMWLIAAIVINNRSVLSLVEQTHSSRMFYRIPTQFKCWALSLKINLWVSLSMAQLRL